MEPIALESTAEGVVVPVQAQPGARRSGIVGMAPDEVMIFFSGRSTQLSSPSRPPVVSMRIRFGRNCTLGTLT